MKMMLDVIMHQYLASVAIGGVPNRRLKVRYSKENFTLQVKGCPLFDVIPILVLPLKIVFIP